jgi:hypothetical protein
MSNLQSYTAGSLLYPNFEMAFMLKEVEVPHLTWVSRTLLLSYNAKLFIYSGRAVPSYMNVIGFGPPM